MNPLLEDRVDQTHDYASYWDILEQLPWVGMAAASMRPGTDAFHSHLDGHPEILSFNGHFFVYDFWKKSLCVNCEGEIDAEDLIDEFIGHFIFRFKSRYDLVERKNQLGEDQNESVDIDIKLVRKHMLGLMAERPITCRNFLFSVYAAYALSRGEPLADKKVVFHHAHKLDRLSMFLEDFPDAKVIGMVRDPRAAIVSGIENWRKYSASTDHPTQAIAVVKRVDENVQVLSGKVRDIKLLRVEDIENEKVMRNICTWMGISFNESLLSSTWGGLRWWGDRLSQTKTERGMSQKEFGKAIRNNKWSSKLTAADKFVLKFLFRRQLTRLGYESHVSAGPLAAILVLLCIPIPTAFELRYFSYEYLARALRGGKYLRPASVLVFYLVRVALYLRMFVQSYSPPLLDPDRFTDEEHENMASNSANAVSGS